MATTYQWLRFDVAKSYSDYKNAHQLSHHTLYASDGRVISQIKNDFTKNNLIWTNLKDVDPDFIDRVLYQEDRNFKKHFGINWLSLLKVTWNNILKLDSPRGASTITMQLGKKLFNLNTKNLTGKFRQLVLASKIEYYWNKNQILEAYLNEIYFHKDFQGLATTTTALFQKSPQYLSFDEQTFLLAGIKNPSLSVWGESKSLNLDRPNWAYHYHQFLNQQNSNSLTTAIDFDLQKFATQTVRSQLGLLKDRNVNDAAVLIIDNHSGNIMTYVGGSGFDLSQAPYVDMVHAKRQYGSVLKPFLYGLAFDKKILNLDSWLLDAPLTVTFPNGTYAPKNHDEHYFGWIHPSQALGSSLNIPAIKTLQLVGVDAFYLELKKLNFKMTFDSEHYGPALALGVLDGSLWDLTHAYQQLAKEKVFSHKTQQKLNWILSRPQSRSLTFGQDSILNVDQGFAVKTGTSKDMRDNWCVGYNRDFTVGVWVGNSDNSSMHNVLGIDGAGPIWRDLVNFLLKTHPPTDTLVENSVDLAFNQIEQKAVNPISSEPVQIRSPLNQTIYAYDPGIPAHNQKIRLSASGDQTGLKWKYKDQFLASDKVSLERGWQRVELYKDNVKIDESNFLVK